MEIHHYKPPIVAFLESRTAKNLKMVIDPLGFKTAIAVKNIDLTLWIISFTEIKKFNP